MLFSTVDCIKLVRSPYMGTGKAIVVTDNWKRSLRSKYRSLSDPNQSLVVNDVGWSWVWKVQLFCQQKQMRVHVISWIYAWVKAQILTLVCMFSFPPFCSVTQLIPLSFPKQAQLGAFAFAGPQLQMLFLESISLPTLHSPTSILVKSYHVALERSPPVHVPLLYPEWASVSHCIFTCSLLPFPNTFPNTIPNTWRLFYFLLLY